MVFSSLVFLYLFLPLKRNFTTNDINILNKSVKLDKDLLSDLNKKKEVTASFSSDVQIRQFLKKYGYSFKNEVKDFYNNVCYTKSNAMVKITDELRKIEKINLTETVVPLIDCHELQVHQLGIRERFSVWMANWASDCLALPSRYDE